MRFHANPCIPAAFVIAIATLQTLVVGSQTSAAELLGYWPLEETDVDQPVIDASGNGLDGEFEGEVDPNVEGAPGFGSGAYFDGVSGQVFLGAGDETGLGDLTSNFSVVAWINPDQFDSKNRVFGSAPHGGAGWGWGTNSDQLELTTWGIKDYTQPVPLELDEWTHAAVVLNEDFEADFYANGEYVGTQTHPSEGLTTVNDFYIGFACCDAEHFSGLLDEVAVFDGVLTEEEIINTMTLGVSNFEGGGMPGDIDGDGDIDADDIDALAAGIRTGDMGASLDVNGDGTVDIADHTELVTGVQNTYIGDSNLDGEFNSADFVAVFTAGKYETGEMAGWAEGDWNADGTFDSSDFVAAFGDGGYEQGPKAAVAAVPEPSSIILSAIGLLSLWAGRRRRRSSLG